MNAGSYGARALQARRATSSVMSSNCGAPPAKPSIDAINRSIITAAG